MSAQALQQWRTAERILRTVICFGRRHGRRARTAEANGERGTVSAQALQRWRTAERILRIQRWLAAKVVGRLDGETVHTLKEKEDPQRQKRRNEKMRKLQQRGLEQEIRRTPQSWLRPQRLLHREQTNVPTSSIHGASKVGNPQRLDHLLMLCPLIWEVHLLQEAKVMPYKARQ